MDLMYIRDKNGIMDSGYLQHYEADFDITTDIDYVTNDFEIKMSLPSSDEELFFSENKIKTIVYVEGTEYGGEITGSIIDTDEKTITYTGRTWRGTLSEWIIEPPAGQDYLVVSCNIATILRDLPHSDYLDVDDTEYTSGSFQFDRYITTFPRRRRGNDLCVFNYSVEAKAISLGKETQKTVGVFAGFEDKEVVSTNAQI